MLPNSASTSLTDLLFDQTDDFIGLYDTGRERFVRVNQAGARMFGFPSVEAFLDDPAWSGSLLVAGQTQPQRAALIQTVHQLGHYEQETELVRQDQARFWGRLVLTPIHDEQAPCLLVRVMSQGRLQQAERDLRQSVLRYEAVFANATIGIMVADQSGQIVSANQMANQLFGYQAGELLGQSVETLVPTQVSQYHQHLRESFNAQPQIRAMGHNRDLNARCKDGSVFPVEISLSYFRLDDKLYAIAYIIDITFKKEAERQLLAHRDRIERLNADLEQKVADRTHALMNTLEKLEQSRDELDKALTAERQLGELKSRFVAMASHEFRTPLTTVLTSATLIEKYAESDQQEKRQKHLQRIRSSVNHLNDILEEFLSVGRIEEGKIETNPEIVEVPQLLRDTIADLQGMLKPGQTIQLHSSELKPMWLDASLLRKVLVNLLSNAIKYSGPDSVVTVQSTFASDSLTLSVTDQGVGMSPDDQKHLFERFFRAKNVSHIPGTGLGLHIVGQYIDLMGGTVTFQSELNAGTTVTLTLPYENHPSN